MYEHSQDDPTVVGPLYGAAMHHARWDEPTEADTAAAVAEVEEILGGRKNGPALLAEVAGILIGFHEGEIDEFRARVAAHYCIAAGADESLADQWIEEGRRRVGLARQPPPGGMHGGATGRP